MIHNTYNINLINNQIKKINQQRILYKKKIQEEEEEDDYEDDENIVYELPEMHTTTDKKSFNLKLFLVDTGQQPQPGIWEIKFIPNTSTYVWRFGNATSFLPISSSLIYTATTVSLPDYPPATFVQGTYADILTNQKYGTPLLSNEKSINSIDFSGQIYAIEKDSLNNIYIGGKFSIVINKGVRKEDFIQNLAKWNPNTSTWSLVNGFALPDPNESVMSIAIIGSDIYLGGNFTRINYYNIIGEIVSVPNVSGFVLWNNTFKVWTTENIRLLTRNNGTASVYAMKFSRNLLYLGGNMYTVNVGTSNPIVVNNIFSLNSSRVPSPLQNGTSNDVYAIDADPTGNLYVGGSFFSVNPDRNNLIVRYIARWRYNSSVSRRKWERIISAQGPSNNRIGLNQPIYAVAVNPLNAREILFGGLFYEDRKRTSPASVSPTITYLASFNTRKRLWTGLDWKRTIPG